MSMQPAVPRGRMAAPGQVLFTPPARLGWTFRSRRDLINPYPEPPPDESMRQQAARPGSPPQPPRGSVPANGASGRR